LPVFTFSLSTFTTPWPSWCPFLAWECGYSSVHIDLMLGKTWIAHVRPLLVIFPFILFLIALSPLPLPPMFVSRQLLFSSVAGELYRHINTNHGLRSMGWSERRCDVRCPHARDRPIPHWDKHLVPSLPFREGACHDQNVRRFDVYLSLFPAPC
jgi:hypothetical protein